MASLTHVCMWSENGWKRITADQAAKLHPGGTVSAHSGLFMCELCGQYVQLTNEGYQVRHFRHSSHEKSKDCPERTFGTSYSYSYNPIEHNLPIKLADITPNSFHFELGLIRIPRHLITKEIKVQIQTKGLNPITYVYSKDRINTEGLSYVSIGDIPTEEYTLNVFNASEEIYNYWPQKINGMDSNGTLFESASGKLLVDDSDVELGKNYYLLTKWRIQVSELARIGIDVKEISCKRVSFSEWRIYEVTANILNEGAAKFLLNLHYRLTSQPIEIQPIWPLYVEGNYVIKHNSDKVILHIKGATSSVNVFPNTAIHVVSAQPKVYEIICRNRQQLISAGRTKALQYTYFWREPIDLRTKESEFLITDILGNTIDSGITNKLPYKGIIRIKSQYDGEIIIKKETYIVEKRKVSSDKTVEIDNLTLGVDIIFLVGLDCVWELHLKKEKRNSGIDNENYMLNRLTHFGGEMILIPHSTKNIAKGFIDYPLIYKWISNCIKKGKINAKAYKTLQNIYRNNMMKR